MRRPAAHIKGSSRTGATSSFAVARKTTVMFRCRNKRKFVLVAFSIGLSACVMITAIVLLIVWRVNAEKEQENRSPSGIKG